MKYSLNEFNSDLKSLYKEETNVLIKEKDIIRKRKEVTLYIKSTLYKEIYLYIKEYL